MIFIFFALILIIAALYFISKDRYSDLLTYVDKKEYSLVSFFPIALYILEKVNYKYNTSYDNKLLNKIVSIYGLKKARDYLIIHWANKISTLLFALVIFSLLGIAVEKLEAVHILFVITVIAALIYGTHKDLDNKIKKRQMSIKFDFPDFLNKLTLLIDAGMNVSSAWSKIVQDTDSQRPLYEELRKVSTEINSGKSEYKAYESFAKRCRTPEITKFVSIVLQNLRKGSSELTFILRIQSNECWEMRKDVAKKMGEEASTKLLLPIAIMFIAILIIAVAPAILQLRLI